MATLSLCTQAVEKVGSGELRHTDEKFKSVQVQISRRIIPAKSLEHRAL